MNKQIPNKQINKFQIFLVFGLGLLGFLFILFVNPGLSIAAIASPSPKVSPSPQATASASLLQKINEIKEKAASKASELLNDVTKKMQNKAYFGIVSSVEGSKVTLKFFETDQTLLTDEYTVFSSTLKSSKKTTALKDFAEGDFVSALGDADDKGVLKAKRLIKSSPIASDSSQLVWGEVQKVNGGAIEVNIADGTNAKITASGLTKLFLGQWEATLLDIKLGRTIVARGTQTKNAGLSSTYIYVVPQSASAKPEKTPDPTKAASPSASPKRR